MNPEHSHAVPYEKFSATEARERDGAQALLACPSCQLRLEKHGNELLCLTHGFVPLIDGMPVFVPSEEGFDQHWDENGDNAIAPSKLVNAEKFLKPLLEIPAHETCRRILDAGCGDGVHASVINRKAALAVGVPVKVGLDISMSALKHASRAVHSGWNWICGDVLALPFATGSFDATFSYGVLAYTESPRKGFDEMCRVTRPGGMVGVWFLPKNAGLMGRLFQLARLVVTRLPEFWVRRVADCVVPFLYVIPTTSGVTLSNATWKQCREIVLVNIAPPRFYFPTRAELKQWFAENKIEITYEDTASPLTLWGRKAQ